MTPFTILLIVLGLLIIFVPLSVFLTPSKASGGERINRGTKLFLVMLRLAIGWQFLSEGLDKLNDPGWTSEHYLRSSTGPLAPQFRKVADSDILAKLDLGPDNKTFPDALDKAWGRYFEKLTTAFELDSEHANKAKKKLDDVKKDTLEWMTTKQQFKKYSPYVDRTEEATVTERIAAYNKAVEEIEYVVANNVIPYGSAAEDKLKNATEEANALILGLRSDLMMQTEKMKSELQKTLPSEKSRWQLPDVPPPPMSEWSLLDWSDHVVPWLLTIVGGMLLAGLLTRTASFVAALFMLSLYLTLMPLPGWPAPPRTEGNYLYVNKNLIEMFALFVLATTRCGRWLGLDGLIFALFWSGREQSAQSGAAGSGRSNDGVEQVGRQLQSISAAQKEENPHGS